MAEWGRKITDKAPWRTIHQICGNMRLLTDGPHAAVGSTMLIVFMGPDASQSSAPFNVGEDHDRFVHTDHGWRFASRRWFELYTRGEAIELP
jgi:hypothetical protein